MSFPADKWQIMLLTWFSAQIIAEYVGNQCIYPEVFEGTKICFCVLHHYSALKYDRKLKVYVVSDKNSPLLNNNIMATKSIFYPLIYRPQVQQQQQRQHHQNDKIKWCRISFFPESHYHCWIMKNRGMGHRSNSGSIYFVCSSSFVIKLHKDTINRIYIRRKGTNLQPLHLEIASIRQQPFWCWLWDILTKLRQYHDRCCPGLLLIFGEKSPPLSSTRKVISYVQFLTIDKLWELRISF